METDDKNLILKYLEGDQSALGYLIEQNLHLVYRFAFRMARDTHDAEDITQETFVKLWRYAHRYDENKNFRAWLLSIAHNTAIDLLRKRKNFVFSDFETETGENRLTDTLADPTPLAHEVFVRAEEKQLLDGALSKLPPHYREILSLHLEEELTFNEIGDIMDKPLNTIKSQYRRALLALRSILESTA